MMSWNELKKKFDIRGFDEGHKTISISRDGIQFFLTLLYHNFDEEYYLSHNEDVRLAYEAGKIGSAFEHYIHFGYYEERFPGFKGFDPETYVQLNEDLHFFREYPDWEQRAIEHYQQHGFFEGRRIR